MLCSLCRETGPLFALQMCTDYGSGDSRSLRVGWGGVSSVHPADEFGSGRGRASPWAVGSTLIGLWVDWLSLWFTLFFAPRQLLFGPSVFGYLPMTHTLGLGAVLTSSHEPSTVQSAVLCSLVAAMATPPMLPVRLYRPAVLKAPSPDHSKQE